MREYSLRKAEKDLKISMCTILKKVKQNNIHF